MADATHDRRIPSLDGLRAMCIIVVLIGHLEWCLHLRWPSSVAALFHVGKFAVRTFLAISGFLITRPLLQELAKTGTISFRRYYIRRTLRVFPAYYCFLAVMLLMAAFGVVSVPRGDIAIAATYTTDYLTHSWPIGHSWSLSVQEQFYVLWPLLLMGLGSRRGLWFAAALLVLAPISRAVFLGSTSIPETRLDAYADSLAVGCLLAAVRDRMLTWGWLHACMKTFWGFVGPVVIAIVIQWMDRRPNVVAPWVLNLFLFSVQNGMIVLIIHWSMLNAHLGIGRFLNSRTMTFLGAISYSIYLWQQPFLNPYVNSPFTRFPLNLIGLAACALASYYVVELPSFALRRRLEARVAPRTPGQPKPSLPVPALES